MSVDHNNLVQYAALIDTERMARRIVTAQDHVRAALHHCQDLAISLSGGKDSVAAAIIARSVKRDMPIVIAHPPNPLPYRDDHVHALRAWFGGPWIDVPYPWEVGDVLEARARYPAGLKIKALLAAGQDGYVLGLRISESRIRAMTYRKRGAVYHTVTGWRCLPVATWSAEDVIGLAAFYGAPIAEPYRLPLLGMQLDDVRDGTWWAHRADAPAEDWIRRNYPGQHGYWLKSAEIGLIGRREGF